MKWEWITDYGSGVAADSRVPGLVPGGPLIGKSDPCVSFTENLRDAVHEHAELSYFILLQILSKTRMQAPPRLNFFALH